MARLALEDINFHVDDGEFVFLLGHSGAGKSTLLKLILRETLPTSGKVTVTGQGRSPAAPPQDALPAPSDGHHLSGFPADPKYDRVRECGLCHACHSTSPQRSISQRVEYMLELVHLEDKAKCLPGVPFPAASSSVWLWRVRWCIAPSWSSRTSLPATLTRS
ncbi:MAG: ATP-binding cassette domain-containing protein [Faecalibacterium prausnitzii]